MRPGERRLCAVTIWAAAQAVGCDVSCPSGKEMKHGLCVTYAAAKGDAASDDGPDTGAGGTGGPDATEATPSRGRPSDTPWGRLGRDRRSISTPGCMADSSKTRSAVRCRTG